MQEEDNPSSARQFTEAELFSLYWLQYFIVPMREKALHDLWGMRPGAAPLWDNSLPIDRLVRSGLVRMDVRDSDDRELSLVRSAFTADEFRTILLSVEKHDWRFKANRKLRDWVWHAFPRKSVEQLTAWSSYFDWTEAFLQVARSLHVFVRWGYWVMYYLQRVHLGYADAFDIADTLGNDAADRVSLFQSMGGILCDDDGEVTDKDLMSLGTERLKRMWNATTIPCSLDKAMMTLAEFAAESLKSGNATCGAYEQSLLVSLLAVRAFRRGEDVSWELGLLERLSERTEVTDSIAEMILSIAFWRGDHKLIKRYGELLLRQDRSNAYACVLTMALDGDLEVAAKRLSGAVGLQCVNSSGDAIRLPALLTWMVIYSKVKNNRTAVNNIVRYLESVYSRSFDDVAANVERHLVNALSLLVTGCVDQRIKGRIKDALKLEVRLGVCSWLRTSLALSGAEAVFAGSSRDGDKELAIVEQMTEAGYLTMAADAVAEIRAASNLASVADRAAALADRIASLGGVAVIGPRQYLSPWEKALDAIEVKMLGSRKNVQEADEITRGRIAWCWHVYTGGAEQFVDLIGAVYIGVRKDGGDKVPAKISEGKLLSGTYDAVMTDDDLQLRNELARLNVLREKPSLPHVTPTYEVLRLFGNVKELRILASRGKGHDYFADAEPVRLEFDAFRIAVTASPDGGVCVSTDHGVGARSKRSYAIERDGSDRSLWRVKFLSAAYRELQSAIYDLAYDGRIVIPRDGLPRVEKLMARLGRSAPIAWQRQADDESADVKRRPADAQTCVRLRYDGGSLSVHLVMRLSRDPEWTSEPAQGMPERLVVLPDGRKEMIVRDFAAEEVASAVVRQAMNDFPAAPGVVDRWTFDGAEESLEALSTLYRVAQEGKCELEWPDGKRLDLANVVTHSASISGGETADYWLSVTGEFKLDDGKVLSFVDLLRNFDTREGAYVKLTDARYLKLTAALARRIEALKGAGFERGGKFVISPAAVPSLEKTACETEADEYLPLPLVVAQRLDRIRTAFAETPTVPKAFKGTMRPYQEEGFRWLSRLNDCGIGCCLADDMGLGKTIQLIALLAAKKSEGPSLVVAPASVAFNWRNELDRFAPSLRVALVGQAGGGDEEDVAKLAKKRNVIVTSYGVAASRLAAFASVEWNVLVLDEAQAIKNHLTQRAKSVKELKARFRVAATGTPVENRLTELWSIFDFLNPGMLGGETRFAKELAPRGEASPRLKRLVKPLLLRRIKRDVLTDLPEKEEITVPVVLGDEERHAYEATRISALARLEEGDRASKIAILAELTRLRRFCCHPSLVMPSMQVGAKLEALALLLAELKENGHRALVFSQFVDFLAIVRKMLEANGWTYQYLDGSTSKSEREKEVEAFQDGEGDFFLISLKAGGMGLNLTAANYVILLDPWWNPAVENQAADRVHRIGQRLPVTVYRLIAQDTIEEKVVNLHAKKTALAEDILATGAASLSAEAMLGLLEG